MSDMLPGNFGILPEGNAPQIFGVAFARGLENRQQRDFMQHKMQQDQENQNASEINKSLDVKDFLTGGVYDPIIIKLGSEALDAATQWQLKNPGANPMAVRQMLNPYVSKLALYKAKAKEFDSNINQITNELKGIKGINADRAAGVIKQYGLSAKSPDQIPSDLESMKKILDEHNHELVISDDGVSNVFKNQGKSVVSKEVVRRSSNGATKSELVKYNLPTFATINDDGVPVVRGYQFKIDKPVSQFNLSVDGQDLSKDQKIQAQHYLRGTISDKDGNVQLMDDDAFDGFMKDEGFRRNIAARSKAYMDEYEQQHGEKFPRGGIMEELLQKSMAHKVANQYLDSQVIEKEKDLKVVFKDNGGASASDAKKQEEKQQTEAATINLWKPFRMSMEAAKGQYVNLGSGTKNIDPRTVAEITKQVREKDGNDANPNNYVMTWDEQTGTTRVYKKKGNGAGGWVISVSEASLNNPVQINTNTRAVSEQRAKQNAKGGQQTQQGNGGWKNRAKPVTK